MVNENNLSPYDYWQFWRNTDDRDVKRFLNFFTDIETKEINKILKKEKNINNLKILLANEATKILHGDKASKKSEKTAKETFQKGGFGSELPEIRIKLKEIKDGINFLDFIAYNKILPSKSEARAIDNKGFKIDDVVLSDKNKILHLNDFKKNVLKFLMEKRNILVKITWFFSCRQFLINLS